MLWSGLCVPIWKPQTFQSSIKSFWPLCERENVVSVRIPVTQHREDTPEIAEKGEPLIGGLFSWIIYICRWHPTQILEIPNNLECFSAGLNSSFHQLALWWVPRGWLPWARCGVCNGLVHKSCPSNATEAKHTGMASSAKATQISSVSTVIVICKDEPRLTKQGAVKCALWGSYCTHVK